MAPRTVWKFELAGWLLFVLSALAFLAATLRAGDGVGAIASGLFLLACLVFLVPVWALRPKGRR